MLKNEQKYAANQCHHYLNSRGDGIRGRRAGRASGNESELPEVDAAGPSSRAA